MQRPLCVKRHRLRRDPDQPIKAEITRLRRTASADPDVMAMCDDVEKLLNQGWTERRGPREPRVAKLHPLWKRVPPEMP